jgi:hypothetical protein
MEGYRDYTDSGDELAGRFIRQAVKGSRAYGCLFAVLLGGAMSFVIFLGNIMGDCTPGPGCHDHDVVHILKDLAIALPIIAVLGAGVWLLASVIRTALRPAIGDRLVSLLLLGLTLALAWFAFDPAMETALRWIAPANS